MRIVRPDAETILEAAELFDHAPTPEWTERFLASEIHHVLFALADERRAIGFVSGIETTHPDKGTEMFLYELSVHAQHRNRGVGRALVGALADLAQERGCYGMWVLSDDDNRAALAASRAAGAGDPEPTVMLSWTFDRG